MKTPLHTVRPHDGKADGGDGITAGDWAEARAVAAQGEASVSVKQLATLLLIVKGALEGSSMIRGAPRHDALIDKIDLTLAAVRSHAVANAPEPDLAAENARLREALARAELSTVQIRMAADIGRSSAAKREAWFRSQLAQLGREIRETLNTLKP